MSDDESRFVYALDKLLPILNIYLDGGRSWRKEKVIFVNLWEGKKDKVLLSPLINDYFLEICSILKIKEKDFFGRCGSRSLK